MPAESEPNPVTAGPVPAVRRISAWIAARLPASRSAHRHLWVRRIAMGIVITAVSLTGVVIGIQLGAHHGLDVGPFRAQMTVTPSWGGETEVDIPPLGSLHLNSHDGPVHLRVQLGSLDQARTEALIDDPNGITRASETVVADVTEGVTRLVLRTLGAALLGALLLSAVVFRDIRRTAWAGLTALVVTAGSLGIAAGTIRPDSIATPRYEGLLVNAPAVVGDARKIADNYGRYADQLQALVSNVSRVYSAVSTLPVYEPAANTTRVLHVSDLHLNPSAWSVIKTVIQQFDITMVIDTGDIVDWGSSAETSFLSAIGGLGVPYVYIRGNHDSQLTAEAVDRQANTTVLDDTVATVGGLTIAGIGDPRFTPDKTNEPADGAPADADEGPETRSGQTLAATVRSSATKVDVALVHDPASAGPLDGTVPIVLAGHTHQRAVSVMAKVPDGVPTRLMVQGSSGGAGLRGVSPTNPVPLAMSVLYFDEQHVLKAYDDIRVGGTGQTQVTLERQVVGDPNADLSPSSPGPSGSGQVRVGDGSGAAPAPPG